MTISLSSYAGGGLNQADVDARVVAVSSGRRSRWVPVAAGNWDNSVGTVHTISRASNAQGGYAFIAMAAGVSTKAQTMLPLPENLDTTQDVFLRHFWCVDGTSGGNVRWQSALGVYAPDGYLTAGAIQAAETPITVAAGSVAQILKRTDQTDVSNPALTKSGLCWIQVQRRGNDASDTNTNNVRFLGFELIYFVDHPAED